MITQTNPITHPSLPGVQVFPLSDRESLEKGKPQQVLVSMQPNAVIPSHRHNCDAHMFVVAGEAEVISDNPEFYGARVGRGCRVFFRQEQNHGFRASDMGLEFISTNDGIVDEAGNWDIQFAKQ